MIELKPFWRYYGGKWRSALRYPEPRHRAIVEPFAGAAGYSLRYPDRAVTLVERDPVIAELWRWLIAATSAEVLAIPLCDSVDDLPSGVAAGARSLVGFAMNAAVASPRRAISRSGLALRSAGRRFYGWTVDMRARVAAQVDAIRHWKVIEGDYTAAPNITATWYIDPPYRGRAGSHYKHGSSAIDYAALAGWCRARRGQRIVCEAEGADWLPFRRFVSTRGIGARPSREAIWSGAA